ncbi:MAG: Smr/MutS family protein [Bacteroidaceae bacterium]|nr:Smr/MutS family protein [Bacteroidaceae bacterium]
MIYPQHFEQKIGFTEIRQLLSNHCLSSLGRSRVEQMTFLTKPEEIRLLHQQIQEFRRIMAEVTELPEQNFFDLRPTIQRIRIEGVHLDEKELQSLYLSLRTLHSWVDILREEGEGALYPALHKLTEGVFTFHSITKRAEQILDRYGRISDNATPELANIRQELRKHEGSVSRTLNKILKAAQAEGWVDKDVVPTLRDGRLVIPAAPAMKRKLKGIIHDESSTGKTVFIEPAEVVEVNNHIRELEAEEKREVIRILKDFTELLRPNIPELARGYEFLADVEFVRAKAHLADQIGGVSPQIEKNPLIDWTLAQHPLLALALKKQDKKVVPLEIELNKKQRILVISGPNAGGKSVCLKTVGLLQYMLQCGLAVPMGENSKCGIFKDIFIDIGDEQSIEDDLSTYSSHLLNMKNMMRGCNPHSLLLIDEFGGGTEPTIGGAIAEAVLKRFVKDGAYGVITTHYQNLKHFAEDTPGVVNGAMLYDRHRMEALFQLQIGNPGSSFAVEIARKIGIPEEVISDATEIVGKDYVNADKYLLDITRDKRYWEGKRQTIHSQEKQMESTIERYEKEMAELKEKRKEIIREAKKQAEQILQDSNAVVEKTIREIKEAQAEKDRTRKARQEIDDFRARLEEQLQHEHDEMIERKMRQIQERRKRKEERKKKNGNDNGNGNDNKNKLSTQHSPKGGDGGGLSTFNVKDTVRLKGQTTVGVIEEINGQKASVAFGMVRTRVELSRLQHAAPKEKKDRGVQIVSFVSKETQNQVREKHLHFHQEIDVRGMRGDEALQAVTHFIDDATLVGASQVRILHGTGNGILRQLIRQYLQTVPNVSSAHDEHVQFGGAGITVVELS